MPRGPLLVSPPTAPVLWMEAFEALRPERWQEASVRGHTRYEAVTLDDRSCLKAESQDGASLLLSEVHFNPRDYPWFSWEWRVDRLVEGEALDTKSGSDASARVYVYFETAGLPWQKRNLDYVWSAALPVGTILDSAFSAESRILVVESGHESLGQWRRVERNLEQDYRRVFRGPVPNVIAIGIMTDTDNTYAQALAYFDELRVSRFPLAQSERR